MQNKERQAGANTDSKQMPIDNSSSPNAAKLPVVSSYLRGLGRIHDFEFADLAEKHGRTEDELIEDLANEGWTIGKDDLGHNVWWE